ncbi:MAG TPA: TraB/GumN family protein [Allosphingosinicella sp.]|nr:TraB/GumN family protein [Allosphingosinicella sp.]
MNWKAALFGLFASLSLAGCATAPSAQLQSAPAVSAQTGPALWELSDADTKIYLFGTIHMLPKGQQWRTPALERAIAESGELVTEVVIGDNPAGAAQAMMKLGTSPGLPPLIERVPEAKRPALARAMAASRIPAGALDRLETWVAAITLTAGSFQSLGFEAGLGVEEGLNADYKAKGRPISGLETVEEQFGFFDQLSEKAQRELLESALEDPAKVREQLAAMLRTWSSGDEAGMARTFDTELKKMPELREILLVRRNQRWAQWLKERLDRPGTILVAVGAGHLAGDESVQAMLRKRGLKVRRVQ